jgi:mannose-1-phosphate guanylyltransferase
MVSRYAVIMAGGKGERFWPRSRRLIPKQFMSLSGEKSLLRQSYERIRKLFAPGNILVVTGRDYITLARQQLPDLPPGSFLVEPEGRNTAPCIGLAALHLHRRDPQSVMAVFPADHLVRGRKSFLNCLETGLRLAETETAALVTIGISPTRPETGYGYIEREDGSLPGNIPVFRVRRFVEKPDLHQAAEYLRTGRFFWNSGIFIGKTGVILEKVGEHMPELYRGLSVIGGHIGSKKEQEVMNDVFPSLPAVSFDYGVMEKEKNILVVRGDFSWDDLGSWAALARWFPRDSFGTVAWGEHIGVDTAECLVYGQDALIATLGVKNLVIVQTQDVVLVCEKSRSQEIKKLVQMLAERKAARYL